MTLYWDPGPSLPAWHCVRGQDVGHWFIHKLVWGPCQDALGQEVFLARVSGMDDFREQVDWIMWVQQQVDIPLKLIHSYLERLEPDASIGHH